MKFNNHIHIIKEKNLLRSSRLDINTKSKSNVVECSFGGNGAKFYVFKDSFTHHLLENAYLSYNFVKFSLPVGNLKYNGESCEELEIISFYPADINEQVYKCKPVTFGSINCKMPSSFLFNIRFNKEDGSLNFEEFRREGDPAVYVPSMSVLDELIPGVDIYEKEDLIGHFIRFENQEKKENFDKAIKCHCKGNPIQLFYLFGEVTDHSKWDGSGFFWIDSSKISIYYCTTEDIKYVYKEQQPEKTVSPDQK